MATRLTIRGNSSWFQTVPWSLDDPRTQARVLALGDAHYQASEMQRTVTIQASESGNHWLAIWLGTDDLDHATMPSTS